MAAESVLPLRVYEGQDFYVPGYRIILDAKELQPETNDIMSVTYSDSLTQIDSFDLSVNNWDAEALKFKYSDGTLFNPWKDVQVFMGYHRDGRDDRRRMLTGEITTLTPNFPASGAPTLSVRGLNLFHRFRTKQDVHSFFNQTDTEIAQYLVQQIDEVLRKKAPGLRVRLDDEDIKRNKDTEQPVPFLLMNNQYPIVFLMERARRLGYDLTMEEIPRDDKSREVIFHFRRSNSVKTTTYELKWGVSLISFQPALRTADQVSKVTVRGWNPKSKKPIEKFATRADLKGEGVVDPGDLAVIEPPLAQEVTVDLPVANEKEAEQQAKSFLRQKALGLVTAKGKTVGLPDLRAGVKVKILDLGRFSGTYLVTETTHSISDGGYTTDFTARMEGGPDTA